MFAKRYARFYNEIHRTKPYKKEVDFVYKWGGNPKTILDLGCGNAQYWEYYPTETKIIGVDQSREMVKESPYKPNIVVGDVGRVLRDEALRGYLAKIIREPKVSMATALFDVLNYIPDHSWWEYLPIKKGGHFIFDIWDAKKVNKDGFRVTEKNIPGGKRKIIPLVAGNMIQLWILLDLDGKTTSETHDMYIHTEEQIKKYCGNKFVIEEKKETKTWQTWYKVRRL